jgi:predicted glycosyltransferase
MFWFDLDNSPHVPLFRPILYQLAKRNMAYFVTSRIHAQTEDLLRLWNIPHMSVGVHGGKSKLHKIINLIQRSRELTRAGKDKHCRIAISHGSRTHLLAAKRLGIPYIWMSDYEYSEQFLARLFADYLLFPTYISDQRLISAGFDLKKVVRYQGFKEEIYLENFVPDLLFRKSIGVDDQTILITLRPPSMTANYHDPRSEILFQQCLRSFSVYDNALCLIVNRTSSELGLIPHDLQKRENVRILEKTVDGLQLMWNSDLVVSGGGTMNRESALLGVPTFSIFTGKRPAMDEYLNQQGKLNFVETAKEIETIPVEKRTIQNYFRPSNPALASRITDQILSIGQRLSAKAAARGR